MRECVGILQRKIPEDISAPEASGHSEGLYSEKEDPDRLRLYHVRRQALGQEQYLEGNEKTVSGSGRGAWKGLSS